MSLARLFMRTAGGALLCCASAQADPIKIDASRIPLYPDRPADNRAGTLNFRGGLVLSSGDGRFGGWSDLAVSTDGTRLLTLSDRGRWLRARLSYDAKGDLSNVDDGDIAPVIGLDGKPVSGADTDSEGLTVEHAGDLDGPVAISFERNTRIWRYDFSKGRDVRPEPVTTGNWVKRLHNNAQLEAITIWRPGMLLAFGEAKVKDGEDLLGAMEAYPGDGTAHTRMLSVIPHDPFNITGAANAPDGGLFLLERRFSLAGGMGMEIRHIPESAIKEGARLDGEVLTNLSFLDANIDNMEGIATRKGPRGETLLYIVSDDNFLPFQRTLLLMFEVKPSR